MLAILSFPSPDPIPLPAPVWLFKVLHGTVLSLHFITVQWLLGWLLAGIIWNAWGRARRDQLMVQGSAQIARSLPLIMTYLINFGIPPLLFTQVLYGSFLYTSSVVIGAWWISVVPAVIVAYFSLYVANHRAEKSRAWWGLGLLSLVVAILIARIYSSNMTLMLRPEAWTEMYRSHPGGTVLPGHDPTIVPRWLAMLAGSLTLGGLLLIIKGVRQKAEAAMKTLMVSHGGAMAAMGAVLQSAAAWQVMQAQPGTVRERLAAHAFYQPIPWIWMALAGLIALLGLAAVARRGKASGVLGAFAGVLGFLFTTVTVIYRDGIRDMALLAQGYDVWKLNVVANWPVVFIFIGTFVLGVIIVGWMASLALNSKTPSEKPALSKEPAL